MLNFEDNFTIENGFPRPDWHEIATRIEKLPPQQWVCEWSSVANRWLEKTAECLPDGYRLEQSENFIVLLSEDGRYANLLTGFLERALHQILVKLEGIAVDSNVGKHVALMFKDHDSYYDYTSYFYPDEGSFAMSSGVFLNAVYGHFALPMLDMHSAEVVCSHELTHACLRHLPIPAWLNEGLAVTLEDEICGSQPLKMDGRRMREHQSFWNADTIQGFWSGELFGSVGIGNELSYELGRYCVRSLAQDFPEFVAFANNAHFADGGQAAALDVYDGSLGGLVHQFCGPGDWCPTPDTWGLQAQ